ncbi:hypothetical protein [Methylobacterium sp. 10]|uniref:hypothetical protein n=1 Tax=Methylobacterium sp. 10 TaxID=1101191 RepID=UPI000488BB93|nr:hypothetical protein [Methylobacterium sp. 10]
MVDGRLDGEGRIVGRTTRAEIAEGKARSPDTIDGTFLKAGLIDEISLLMSPPIDGLAGVPSPFDHHGEPSEKSPPPAGGSGTSTQRDP